jgi:hypothetical protein
VQFGIPLSVVTSLAFAAPGPATEMPMPIPDDITQPDPAEMEEMLNRNDHHTLDAKDPDGSMSFGSNREEGAVMAEQFAGAYLLQ